MAGASEDTQRVTYVNANWSSNDGPDSSAFELQIVTEDQSRHAVEIGASDVAAVLALIQASGVMLWDPVGRTLIAANLAGEWIQPSWSAGDRRLAGEPHPRG